MRVCVCVCVCYFFSGSLHDVPISAGEMIVLSEQGGRVALCTGFLLDVGSEHVDVALDR